MMVVRFIAAPMAVPTYKQKFAATPLAIMVIIIAIISQSRRWRKNWTSEQER
jgi:hypothetical protein